MLMWFELIFPLKENLVAFMNAYKNSTYNESKLTTQQSKLLIHLVEPVWLDQMPLCFADYPHARTPVKYCKVHIIKFAGHRRMAIK